MRLTLSLLIIFVFILLHSCKTQRPTLKQSGDATANQPKLKNYGIGKLLDSITSKYLMYENLSIKFKLQAEFSQETHELEGVLRIKKDSLMWISLTAPLGIEVARVVLSKDSVIFLNKLKREYLIKPYNYFENLLHVELAYTDLQSIFTNQIFLFSETDEERNLAMNPNSSERDYIKKTFFRDKDSVNYVLKTHRKHKIKRMMKKPLKDENNYIVENIKILPKLFKIQTVEVFDYIENRYLLVNYGNFERIHQTYFPTSIDFHIKDSTQTVVLKLQYQKITLNQPFNFSITIPESYKKLY
ncbi:MAG: DUF4292 domain-containing protein [Bacteroidales bacterium]|nr:DUF4292 domain-containing protein [Bacteroidales bacterium]